MTATEKWLALDSNILMALLHGEAQAPALAGLLAELQSDYRFVICLVVYAEVLAGRGVTVEKLHDFLQDTEITLETELDLTCWQAAAHAYEGYSERRRRSGGGMPRRLLADFVVGAHALQQAGTLLTADPQHYRLGFPELTVLEP